MSGKKSRSKGYRGEYLVRDYFRALGYESNRVPSSGAAEGFKGDVTIRGKGLYLTTEVKFRRNDFKSIYEMYDTLTRGESKLCIYSPTTEYITISYMFDDLGYPTANAGAYALMDKKYARTVKKVVGLRKLLKTCDFLTLKINNRPLLFIRYL